MAFSIGTTEFTRASLGDTEYAIISVGEEIVWQAEDSVSWTGTLRKWEGTSEHRFGSVLSTGQFDTGVFSGFVLPPAWVVGNATAYVRIVFFNTAPLGSDNANQDLFLRVSTSDTGNGGDAGPDLIPSIESALQCRITVGSNVLLLDSAVADTVDTAEPYQNRWRKGSDTGMEMTAFMNALAAGTHTATVTLINPT